MGKWDALRWGKRGSAVVVEGGWEWSGAGGSRSWKGKEKRSSAAVGRWGRSAIEACWWRQCRRIVLEHGQAQGFEKKHFILSKTMSFWWGEKNKKVQNGWNVLFVSRTIDSPGPIQVQPSTVTPDRIGTMISRFSPIFKTMVFSR